MTKRSARITVRNWRKHSELPKEQRLPVPRLEMECVPLDAKDRDGGFFDRAWIYRLVYRHFLGHCVSVPLGITKQGGGGVVGPENLVNHLPFREGAHLRNDMAHLRLPAFAVVGDYSVALNADLTAVAAGTNDSAIHKAEVLA